MLTNSWNPNINVALGSIMMCFNKKTMKLSFCYNDYGQDFVYLNSLNQYLAMDDYMTIYADHLYYDRKGMYVDVCDFYGYHQDYHIAQYHPIRVEDPLYSSLGGLEASSTAYMIVGTMTDQNYSDSTVENAFLSTINKTSEATTITYLTDLEEGSTSSGTPYLIKVDNDNFVVMFQLDEYVKYAYVDGKGNLLSELKSIKANLTSMTPKLFGNRIYWGGCTDTYEAVTTLSRLFNFYSIPATADSGDNFVKITPDPTATPTPTPTSTPSPTSTPTPTPTAALLPGEIRVDDINFPNRNLRSYVLSDIDKNGDMKLSPEEMNACKKIEITDSYGSTDSLLVGTEYFPNLEEFDVEIYKDFDTLLNLDMSKNTKLTTLSVERRFMNETRQFNVDYDSLIKNKNLTSLSINGGVLGDVDTSVFPNLEELSIYNGIVKSIDISGSPKLTELAFFNNNISKVDISGCQYLCEGWYKYYDENHHSINMDYPIAYLETFVLYEDTDFKYVYIQVDSWNSLIVPTPTPTPTATPQPTEAPTSTAKPTTKPVATVVPTVKPTVAPTTKPVATTVPTAKPTTTPVATATVTPTKKPTAKPTNKPTAVPTEEPSKYGTVEDFAERLYTTCLGRDAEEAGKDYWTSELKAGKPGSEVAAGFFFSPEYEGKKLSNKDFIKTLYETFMGRSPADAEVDYWESEMKSGKDRKFIFDGFVNSPEWADICLTYGIRSGGLASPTFEKDASDDVKAFAERLYTTCLGRKAEKEGLEWWAAELANLRQTGKVAAEGFFFSSEFVGLKTSDKEYVTRLYRTFMGREPEEAGFKFWTDELKSGKDRKYVFDGFAAAPEFVGICADAGIMA